MNSASEEWVARVAARNAIEIAKAQRAGTPASTRLVPLSAGARPGLADGSASAGREVAK